MNWNFAEYLHFYVIFILWSIERKFRAELRAMLVLIVTRQLKHTFFAHIFSRFFCTLSRKHMSLRTLTFTVQQVANRKQVRVHTNVNSDRSIDVSII